MVRAARVADLATQPAEGVLQQGNRLQAGGRGFGASGIIGRQQLHQGGGDLFSATTGALGLEGMPLAIADRQAALQVAGQRQGVGWPGGAGRRRCGGRSR